MFEDFFFEFKSIVERSKYRPATNSGPKLRCAEAVHKLDRGKTCRLLGLTTLNMKGIKARFQGGSQNPSHPNPEQLPLPLGRDGCVPLQGLPPSAFQPYWRSSVEREGRTEGGGKGYATRRYIHGDITGIVSRWATWATWVEIPPGALRA